MFQTRLQATINRRTSAVFYPNTVVLTRYF